MKKISILIVGTKRYYDFALDLIESLNSLFLTNHELKIYLFTDRQDPNISNVKIINIQHKPWPGMTLLRYHMFCDIEYRLKDSDYIFYIDADMKVIEKIGDEILGDRVAIQHVGYFDKSPEEWEFDRFSFSEAYIPVGAGDMYYHATLIGATTDNFLHMCHDIKGRIENDFLKPHVPIWHDESYYNKYLYLNPPTKVLDPGYAYFFHWRSDTPFKPKIININKNDDKSVVNLRCKRGDFLFRELTQRINDNKYTLNDSTIVIVANSNCSIAMESYINKYLNVNIIIVSPFYKVEELLKEIKTDIVIFFNDYSLVTVDYVILSEYIIKNNYYDLVYLHNGIELFIGDDNFKKFKIDLSIENLNIESKINASLWDKNIEENIKHVFPISVKKDKLHSLNIEYVNEIQNCDVSGISNTLLLDFCYKLKQFDSVMYNQLITGSSNFNVRPVGKVGCIIPVVVDNLDTHKNLNVLINYLLNILNLDIIVGYIGKIKIFNEHAIYQEFDSTFSKSSIINTLVEQSDRNIICIYSPNIIIDENAMLESISLVENNKCDYIIPHSNSVKKVIFEESNMMEVPSNYELESSIDPNCSVMIIKTSHYLECGLENINYNSWIYRSDDLLHRLKILNFVRGYLPKPSCIFKMSGFISKIYKENSLSLSDRIITDNVLKLNNKYELKKYISSYRSKS